MTSTRRSLVLCLPIVLMLGACSSTPENPFSNLPPDELYTASQQAIKRGQFKKAGQHLQEIDQKHPFSNWATKAQINLIYSHFRQEEYDDALSAAERFIRLHPRHPQVAYAFYMRALSEFKRISDPMRDQHHTKLAAAALNEVVTRFPNSDYADESRRMLMFCMDHLAAQEVTVGRFYLDRREWIAASNRFRRIIEQPQFNVTPYVEEALFSMTWISWQMGLPEEARHYGTVLGHNFPNGPFYQASLRLLGKQEQPDRSQLEAMRRNLDEDSVIKRFFEGLTPGIPGLTDR
ncbi:MAG: outer membrane protein assembly factor BamD [Magnetococcales bacterium]|nr:outer membrane protein assembly factor BamD [Magnetococcales bacterium]